MDVDAGRNPFVVKVAEGRAPLTAIAALAAEEWRIIPSDRRGFLTLAARADDAEVAGFFIGLAQGENTVLPLLPPLAAAAGMDREALDRYEPRAGCQAYPSFVSWLALNAEPAAAAHALELNFAAWGGCCAALALALRERYGFSDEACAFLDFFAEPDTSAGPQPKINPTPDVRGLARLLHEYETGFWHTLAAIDG